MASEGHFGYLSSYKNETGREMRAHKNQNLFSLVYKHFGDQLQTWQSYKGLLGTMKVLYAPAYQSKMFRTSPIYSRKLSTYFIKNGNDIPTLPFDGIWSDQKSWNVCPNSAKILSLFHQNLDCFYTGVTQVKSDVQKKPNPNDTVN